MSRARLEELGIVLPVMPTTSVGSLPRTEALAQTLRRSAPLKPPREEILKAEQEATAFWIKKQEEIGLDILVDGEQMSGDRLSEVTLALGGFEHGGLVRLYANRYARRPIIISAILWKGPVSVERWAFAQSLTSKPVKAILPGPCTIADWAFSDYYPDAASACKSLAEALRSEIDSLISSGARIIQIDEPALSYRPKMLPIAADVFERMTRDQNAYFITHICMGRFDALYPDVLRLPVHQIDLEAAHGRTDALAVLRREAATMDLGIGVIDVQNRRVEEFRNIKDRIRRATALAPLDAIWIDPDCGLKSRTVDEAVAKLRVMVDAVHSVRENAASRS